MRIPLDPVVIVLGIYAHVGELLGRVSKRSEDADPETLGRRFGRRAEHSKDREVQRLVRALHGDIKTTDKLLRKTADVWKISQETDLVDLVIRPSAEDEQPRAYVLLRPDDVRALLTAIREAAKGAGEDDATVAELERAAGAIEGRPSDYYTFGFDPWSG